MEKWSLTVSDHLHEVVVSRGRFDCTSIFSAGTNISENLEFFF